MGSSSSKVAGKIAAAGARRQYPSTSSILNSASSTSNAPGSQGTAATSTVRLGSRNAAPIESKAEHIDLDGRDPQFSSKLRALGPAMPVADAHPRDAAFPTSSQPPLGQQGQNIFPSRGGGAGVVTNPAIVIVQARERISNVWEEERDALGKGSFAGRTLLGAGEIADVIRMRDEGLVDGDIERKMRLSKGLVGRLGVNGVVANA